MTMGAIAFALMTSVDTIFKLLAEHHPAYQILFVNACFAFIPILTWAKMTGGLAQLRTIHPAQHFSRATVSLMSAFAAIYAYSRLPLTDFYAIVFAGPLIVTAASSLWLNEKVDRARWLAILIGFGGILIVTNPFGNEDSRFRRSSRALGGFHQHFLLRAVGYHNPAHAPRGIQPDFQFLRLYAVNFWSVESCSC